MDHLDERTVRFLESCQGPDAKEKKIRFMDETPWIGHGAVETIWNKMEEILAHPRTHRMPDLIIVARSNSGKTTLLKRFAKLNKAELDEETGELYAPVIAAVMPHDPTEILFVNTLLKTVQLTVKKTDSFPNKLEQLYNALERIDCKVILVDEIQHIGVGTARQQHLIVNMMKNISSVLQLSFIVAGTPEAINIFSFDEQFQSRFRPAVIPPWSANEEMDSLLASFEAVLPLEEPSNLASDEMVRYILSNTDRTIGDIFDLLRAATKYAINKGHRKLTIPVMEKCDHMSPKAKEEEKKKIF
ncbi:MAG TPA: TniB family NTP-binding protein [Cyclobacteriaceae bacterium]|nr:TniB family NTP-binding protein [Cyclobacteriaceae bacterium]HMV10451.1 TniB family NTP-binding protein [Cyclobacteriaceae bacterium]HMX01375.1 TniB family NTP-binding protein [Cyclobacteriaceae bacterium]HMX50355.1 TniB family NTP-binding protein [Cyclobacteriaceae bacterium]HMY92423.1 TniB family NTP-binding protein [Cyclobacteriaceae bacterium]